MKTIAIISEYNPCHKGHAYQIAKAKEKTDADIVIALMSGNFVQRGMPAVFDKYTRAHAAILSGVDIVLELPAVYATASAELFAENSVKILDMLGVDYLSFGIESDNLDNFDEIVSIFSVEPSEYKKLIKDELKKGNSLPLARQNALSCYTTIPDAEKIIASPNNILGIEYLKAIKKYHSGITPVAIKRVGNGYNDTFASTDYPSATAIRKMYEKKDNDMLFSALLPEVFEYLGSKKTLFSNDFSDILMYSIMNNINNLTDFSDVDEKIANRIINCFKNGVFYTYDSLIEMLKTRNYTYTRISRILCHILLNIRKQDITEPAFSRVLAFNDNGKKYLREIRKKSDFILLTDIKDAKKILSENGLATLGKDIFSSNIYRLVYKSVHNVTLTDEYRKMPEIINF